jgi:glycosyltransferase involved in cell wall biosynthesis
LTVAVPTYNGAAHLAEALRSILAQAGIALELVVSDDRSDDETLEIVRSVAGDRARVEINSERLGLAGNWNRCIALCNTPLLAIFHQDDVMMPGHLAAHAAAFDGDPGVGLVASASDVMDDRGRPVPEEVVGRGGLGPADRVCQPGELALAMVGGNQLRCSAVTLRCQALADVGGFDPAYRYVVDADLWLRVSRRWNISWLVRPTVQVRWHQGSETHRFHAGTSDLEETSRLLEQLFETDLKDRPDAVRLRRAADRRLARAFLNRAHDALHAGRLELAQHALQRAMKRAPGVVATLLHDPRLGIQMAILASAPNLARRLFSTRNAD